MKIIAAIVAALFWALFGSGCLVTPEITGGGSGPGALSVGARCEWALTAQPEPEPTAYVEQVLGLSDGQMYADAAASGGVPDSPQVAAGDVPVQAPFIQRVGASLGNNPGKTTIGAIVAGVVGYKIGEDQGWWGGSGGGGGGSRTENKTETTYNVDTHGGDFIVGDGNSTARTEPAEEAEDEPASEE